MIESYNFGTATPEQIITGEVTDKYFSNTEKTLRHREENPHVVAEVSADQFDDGEFEVFAGLKGAVELLQGLPIDVYSIPEGSRFDGVPVMRIEGKYLDFARYETPLLGLLSHASGYATAAYEISQAAGDVPVLSFGSRHIHPALAPYMERASALGGVDGYSNIGAEHVMDDEPSGTMPHALMLSTEAKPPEVWQSYVEATDDDEPNIILCDTFTDEVVEAMDAARALGDDLDGIRLDTTGSRRGCFKDIIREVRHELDEQIGVTDVDIYVSGGIDAEAVRELREYVDGFGVGSAITDADPIDFGLDIVEREAEPVSKRGKLSGVDDVEMDQIIDNGEPIERQS